MPGSPSLLNDCPGVHINGLSAQVIHQPDEAFLQLSLFLSCVLSSSSASPSPQSLFFFPPFSPMLFFFLNHFLPFSVPPSLRLCSLIFFSSFLHQFHPQCQMKFLELLRSRLCPFCLPAEEGALQLENVQVVHSCLYPLLDLPLHLGSSSQLKAIRSLPRPDKVFLGYPSWKKITG